jgi:four helix bundle protein
VRRALLRRAPLATLAFRATVVDRSSHVARLASEPGTLCGRVFAPRAVVSPCAASARWTLPRAAATDVLGQPPHSSAQREHERPRGPSSRSPRGCGATGKRRRHPSLAPLTTGDHHGIRYAGDFAEHARRARSTRAQDSREAEITRGRDGRAAESIALNVSEGRKRAGLDRPDLFRRAAGSADELTTALRIARARGYITSADFAAVDALLDRIRAMLWRLTH